MHTDHLEPWQHDHSFGQDAVRKGERGTVLVVILTGVTMVVEIVAGVAFGSMALLADGLHMASHAVALGIAVAAYVYARKHAHDERFCFGTGKVNALGGFTGALLLACFAGIMVWESVARLLSPVEIVFNAAILVAVLGLAVNGLSVLLLGVGHDHHHGEGDSHHHHDHNLRSAYLHVFADALTSLLAIVALLGGKFLGWNWLDPVMGLVGSALVARWSWGLLRDTSRVLLDHQAPLDVQRRVRAALEDGSDDRVADLHVWSIGPGVQAAGISVISHTPRAPGHYERLIPADLNIKHTTIEVHHCHGPDPVRTEEVAG